MASEASAFGASLSRPRARRAARVVLYVLLLGIAVAAIWWIDRGAMLTNGGAGAMTQGE